MEDKKKDIISVYAIIVNWNGYKDTKACLQSLAQIHRSSFDVHIVVVDNGSTDGSSTHLKRAFPTLTILRSKDNLGFTGGNNLGINYALSKGADILWLLNNDTVVDEDVLTSLSDMDPAVGILGSKIYFAPGREFHHDRYTKKDRGRVLWYAGGLIDWNNMYASHRGVDEVDRGQFDSPGDTAFVTGCSMMVRRGVFETIGMLDNRFYLYLEDVDFCLRAKRAGFRLLYDPRSVLWHVNAGSSDRPGNALHQYYMTRNRLLLGFRYAPLQTRFALVREAVKEIVFGSAIRRRAIIDAALGRFGNRFEL